MTRRPSDSPARRRNVRLLTPALGAALLLSSVTASPASAQDTGVASTSATAPMAVRVAQAVTAAHQAYQEQLAAVASVGEQTSRLSDSARAAQDEAALLRDQVSSDEGGLFSTIGELVSSGDSDLELAVEAAEDAAHARELAVMAQVALTETIDETERARLAWEAAQRRQAGVEAKWSARQVADAAIRRSQFAAAYDVDNRSQDKLNRRALATWRDYLNDLADLAVVPPEAARLRNPDRLPQRLVRVRDSSGEVVEGVGAVDPDGEAAVTVIPSETIRAVSETFRRIGLPTVPDQGTPMSYACGGLLANVWGTSTTVSADTVDQWRELRTVPVRSLQIGDAVVLGNRQGLGRSGVYVGVGRMVVADAETGTAAVLRVPRKGVYGVKRVPLTSPQTYDAPSAGPACVVPVVETVPAPTVPAVPTLPGTPTVPAVVATSGSGPLSIPVGAGTYELSADFGTSGSLWSSGQHTGQDFAAPTGTPVVAAADGVVSVETPSWAGNLVTIDHGGGVETSYAHLSSVSVTNGQSISRGESLGAIGSEGNSTGPHLHLEVRLDGTAVDPALVLTLPERPRETYPNGEVPTTALCAATQDGLHQLRCDAAVAFRLLAQAFEYGTGTELCTTDSYRSRTDQESVFRTKPGLAAVPGTSVHGSGLAVDLCGGVERFDTAEHAWLVAEGPAYGWQHPSWAAEGGSRPEAWHFEYAG